MGEHREGRQKLQHAAVAHKCIRSEKRCVEKIKPYLNFNKKFKPNVKMMKGNCLLNPNWELFDK